MTNQTLGIGALILIVGLAIGYTLGNKSYGPRSGQYMMGDGSYMMNEGELGERGASDQHFIIQMIPHHEGAIEMAKLALERSQRPEIITLANAIVAAQQKEIDDMRVWYGEWFGGEVPEGGMGMHMDGMTGDLSVLAQLTGDAFDREFLEQMIPHHEMALMMTQMIRSSSRGEMQQLAENILRSQAEEIEMMRGWLASWY